MFIRTVKRLKNTPVLMVCWKVQVVLRLTDGTEYVCSEIIHAVITHLSLLCCPQLAKM